MARRGAIAVTTLVIAFSSMVAIHSPQTGLAATTNGCTAAGLTASPTSPAKSGATVIFTASATCPGTPTYRYWVKGPADIWRINQEYPSSNTFNWNTTGMAYGTYGIEVDVRDQGSTAAYEAVFNTTYVIVPITCSDLGYGAGAIPVVTGVSPNWSSVDGTNVTITGCGFTGATAVSVSSFTVVSDTTITARTNRYIPAPGDPRTPGEQIIIDIQVTTPLGTSPIQPSDHFSFFWDGAPCSTATLTASPPTPGPTGSTVVLAASSFTCTFPQYRFWIRPPGGSWHIVQDYPSTITFDTYLATYNWTVPNTSAAGTYQLEVDVRDYFHRNVSYEKVANIAYSLNGCTAAGLTASPTSPAKSGSTVTFTASATCPGTPTYRYWVKGPGDKWRINQEYPSSNTFNWNTTGKPYGTYGIELDVRDQGSTAAYEAVFNTTYVIVPITCSDSGYGAGAIPVVTGVSPAYEYAGAPPVTISGCGFTGATTISYEGGGISTPAFTVVSDTTITTPSLPFDAWPIHPTPGLQAIVDLRVTTPLGTSPVQPSDQFSFFYPDPACSTAGLTASPPSPGATGSTVLLTASTFTCLFPQFRFWIQPPGGVWQMVQDYSAATTYSWSVPNTGLIGTYRLEVDARDDSHTNVSYEHVANITYNLTGCTAAGLSANPSSPQAHGTPVTLTGTATCPGTPTYRFWVKAPGSAWMIARDYSITNTFTWTPAGAGTYSLEVDVRDQGATGAYEKVFNIVYSAT